MENSAKAAVRDEGTEKIRDQMLVKMIKREARLRHIVEQSAFSFFFGDTTLSRILRVTALLAIVIIYIRSDAFASTSLWPLFALGAFLEAFRANRRLDAMLELELIAEQIYPANTGKANRSRGIITP